MLETIRAVALSTALGSLAGSLATLALRRAFGIEEEQGKAAERRPRALETLASRVQSLMPASNAQMREGRDSLARSGLEISPAILWGLRVAGAAAGAVAGTLAVPVLGPVRGAAAVMLGFAAGAAAPQLWVMYRRSRWRAEIDRQLPDALDLLAVCVSAGSSLPAALRRVGSELEGSLGRGFELAAKEAAYSSDTEALLRFAERAKVPALTVFAASLSQAERSGGSVGDILREQAQTARKRRRLGVEEKANKLAAQMLLPMFAFIFPCFVLILVAPMVTSLLSALS